MRLLIDTHILLWVLEADPRLSVRAAELIRNTGNEVFVSAASLMEIAIKKKIGKLDTTRTATEIFQEMYSGPQNLALMRFVWLNYKKSFRYKIFRIYS